MHFKLFVFLFCFLNAQEEKPVLEQEEFFYGFNLGYGNTMNNYKFFSFNRLSFNEYGYEERSFGACMIDFLDDIKCLEQQQMTNDKLNALVSFKFMNNSPIPFYYVTRGYLIKEVKLASLYYGISWWMNTIPSQFVLALHLKKDRYLLKCSVSKSILSVVLMEAKFCSIDMSFSFLI